MRQALSTALDAAAEFRSVVNRRHETSLEHFLDDVHASLARLYAAVLSLPAVDPSDRDYPEKDTYAAWKELYDDLKALLGPIDKVREIFDPYDDESQGPVFSSVADGIATIDVTCGGVLAMPSDAPPEDVIWKLALAFEIQDGHEALDVMRALDAHRRGREA